MIVMTAKQLSYAWAIYRRKGKTITTAGLARIMGVSRDSAEATLQLMSQRGAIELDKVTGWGVTEKLAQQLEDPMAGFSGAPADLSKLTKVQLATLEFAVRFILNKCRPPTLTEVAGRFKVSKVTAWENLQRLKRKEVICSPGPKQRGFYVVKSYFAAIQLLMKGKARR